MKTKTTGRVMFATSECGTENISWFTVCNKYEDQRFAEFTRRVLVLPLTPEAIRATVLRMAKAMAKERNPVTKWAEWYQWHDEFLAQARASLIAQGAPAKLINQALKTK